MMATDGGMSRLLAGREWHELELREAFRLARIQMGSEIHRDVTQMAVAVQTGIPYSTYRTFEEAGFPPPHIFELICHFYEPVWEIADGLRECYDARKEGDHAPSPFALDTNKFQDDEHEAVISKAELRARTLLDSGQTAAALAFASRRWTHIRRHASSEAAAVSFGLITAEIASEAGDHHSARNVLRQVRAFPGGKVEGLNLAKLSIQEAIYANRALALRGVEAAESFNDALATIRSIAGQHPEESPNSDYRLVWNHALRSVVINLTNGFGEEEAQFLSNVHGAYNISVKNADSAEYIVANDLVTDRMLALTAKPELAIAKICQGRATVRLGVLDRLFASHSLIVALTREGDTGGALIEIEKAIAFCEEQNNSRKAEQYRRMYFRAARQSGRSTHPFL